MEAVEGKGKEYTRGDDNGSQQVILRAKHGVYFGNAYDLGVDANRRIFGQSAFLLQTRDGQIVITGSETQLIVYSRKEEKVLFSSEFKYIYWMSMSPNEHFLQVLDKVNTNEGRTLLYSIPDMVVLAEYRETPQSNYYLKTSYPLLRFTSNESYFRYDSKVLEHYSSKHQLIRKIEVGPLEFFEVSSISTEENYLVACLYLDNKTNEGNCALYNETKNEPIYEKRIKKAEEIKVKFSSSSNKFLMELQTYHDPTGKSYYGEYGLYHFNDKANKITKVNTAKGPVHAFSWDRAGINFIVISGFMPAVVMMLNSENQPVFQFGKQHKNQIIWGHLGRLVCLAGFGNLTGEMEIWDTQTKTLVGACKSNSASYCGWSLDDRKLITAVLTPRLRVDNCYKIYSYTGVLLHKVNFNDTELYQATWAKTLRHLKDEPRGLSPGRRPGVLAPKNEAKFMSFSASLGLQNLALEPKKEQTVTLVPGQHPDDVAKPKKKRVRHQKELNVD